ncbi:Fusaric acid resistance protein-like [Micromonospora sediminicola]|uniref:Fusaric acid resistance protein-like n=1 Tax=Micromonospora sediminicola TaxID=946078 RepID=A0A1A9B899_9ACTN|nr:FUSC family protein [Micromonospora sediminicola]SBT65760.1 Fusaric acid resistance protein-like [Micromonospora sediminicola]
MRRLGRDTYDRLRGYLVVALQAGLAAGLSWYVAHDVLEAKQALFAPAAAVGTVAASLGNRVRRTAELIGGVIVGVLVGQVIIDLIGVGPVQTGFVVALAISTAVAFRGSGAIIVQAASTAVLLGTVSPLHQHLAVPRTLNALVGGLTAVVVALLLLPLNPVRVVRRAAGTTLDAFTTQLTAAATALSEEDDVRLTEALGRLSAVEQSKQEGFGILGAAREVARLSPWRRRRRSVVQRYQHVAEHLDRAYADSREMVRWALRVLRTGEPVPNGLAASIEHLGQAVRLLHRDFITDRDPDRGLACAEQAVREVDRAAAGDVRFAGRVAIYQQRVALSALMQAAGVQRPDANRRAGLPSQD